MTLKIIRQISYACFVWFLIPFQVSGQMKFMPQSIVSPNAAALGQYGKVPVSKFTGVPSINIPIYTASSKYLSVPISLSYHAQGLRPDQHPGWVGNGWALNAGGVITRTIKQFPDEFNSYYHGKRGFFYNHEALNVEDWSNPSRLCNHMAAFPLLNSEYDLIPCQDGDGEPDEFSFNFLGFSGSFFMDHTGQWRVRSDQNFKVEVSENDFVYPFVNGPSAYADLPTTIVPGYLLKTFGKFTLIDEVGNKYIFGCLNNSDGLCSGIEFSDDITPYTASHQSENMRATSWYLTKIESANEKENVEFTYQRGPFISQLVNAEDANMASSTCSFTVSNMVKPGLSGKIVSPVYLKTIYLSGSKTEIDFSNISEAFDLKYKIDGDEQKPYEEIFNQIGIESSTIGTLYQLSFPNLLLNITNPAVIPYWSNHAIPASTELYKRFVWLKLNQILVKYQPTGTVIKNIVLNYNEIPQKRLELKNVTINNQAYSFEYNHTKELPDYFKSWTDHWGFNNCSCNNVPQGPISFNDIVSLRNPDPTGVFTQAEILTTINYPTGGKTIFEYEPNTYSKYVNREPAATPSGLLNLINENGVGGGLRVKRVVEKPLAGVDRSTAYFYVNGEFNSITPPSLMSSSGVLNAKPKYSFTLSGTRSCEGATFDISRFFTSSYIPLTFDNDGIPLAYSRVIEQNNDGGYSIVTYTNHDNGYKDLPYVNAFNPGSDRGYINSTSRSYARGKPLLTKVYANNNFLLNEKEIAYSESSSNENQQSRAVYILGFLPCSTGGCGTNSVSCRTAYYIKYSVLLPSTITEKTYQDINDLTVFNEKTTHYTYDSYNNLAREETTNSRGDQIRTDYKYPGDFPSSTTYSQMVQRHIISPMVEKKVTVNNVPVLIHKINYRKLADQPDCFVPSSEEIKNNLGASEQANDTRVTYDLYDTYGNMVEMHTDDNIPQSFVYGYNGQYLVAKVKGLNYQVANNLANPGLLSSLPTTQLQAAHLLNMYNYLQPGISLHTYTHQPLVGVTSETDEFKNTFYYEYNGFQQLQLIRDKYNKILKRFCYKYNGVLETCE